MADLPMIPITRGAPLLVVTQTQTPIATPDRSLQGAPLPLDPRANTVHAQSDRARTAANEFEFVFLNEMLGPMFAGLHTDGLGGGGTGEEMFRPMLIDQYAKAIQHAGGIGIADQIYAELNRMQTTTAAVTAAANVRPNVAANTDDQHPEEQSDGAHR